MVYFAVLQDSKHNEDYEESQMKAKYISFLWEWPVNPPCVKSLYVTAEVGRHTKYLPLPVQSLAFTKSPPPCSTLWVCKHPATVVSKPAWPQSFTWPCTGSGWGAGHSPHSSPCRAVALHRRLNQRWSHSNLSAIATHGITALCWLGSTLQTC